MHVPDSRLQALGLGGIRPAIAGLPAAPDPGAIDHAMRVLAGLQLIVHAGGDLATTGDPTAWMDETLSPLGAYNGVDIIIQKTLTFSHIVLSVVPPHTRRVMYRVTLLSVDACRVLIGCMHSAAMPDSPCQCRARFCVTDCAVVVL